MIYESIYSLLARIFQRSLSLGAVALLDPDELDDRHS